jgi:hypothetical protein
MQRIKTLLERRGEIKVNAKRYFRKKILKPIEAAQSQKMRFVFP